MTNDIAKNSLITGASYPINCGYSNRPGNKPVGGVRIFNVPLGHVEDSDEPRTPLIARFSIRLEEPLAAEEKRPRHPGMGYTQSNVTFTLIEEVFLIQEIDHIKPNEKLLSVPRKRNYVRE